MAGKRTRWIASWLALVALAFLWPQAARATHYPEGSTCYDCHAVSASRMVTGTRLIKMSQKAIDLGIAADATVRCLFCHEKNAVSAPYSDTRNMQGVLDHFDATSTSKHSVALSAGTFTPDGTALDCLDCHVGLSATVASQPDGSTRIHGIDASGTTRVNLYATLLGAPADAGAVSGSTCQNALCHDLVVGDDAATGTPPNRHTFAATTINDGAAPTACTQCHGTHNSYQGAALITLRDNGSTSNLPSDALSTLVTPEKCGECHSQDDAGIYTAKGHGQNTISGGTLGCSACHSGAVPHAFSGDNVTNPLRFAYAENTTAQSAIRQQPPYNQVFSICLTCHSQYTGKTHGTAANAGCNDCHEPHGVGVSTNVKMIRRQIPKVNASGVPIYGASSPTGTWETNFYTVARDDTYKTDGTGLCDNAECHQGRIVAGDLLYPLSTFLTGGRHSGGDISTAANFDCESCHTHTDTGGSWGAKASCTTCHGQPPPPSDSGYTNFAEGNTPHQKHAMATDSGGYGYPCQTCHFDYTSAATHNTEPKTYQSLNFDSARNPSPARSYTAGTATCANLYCHSDGQTTASVGSAQWMTGTSTPNWSTQDLACNACHGGIDVAGRIATGSHTLHLNWADITCVSCHGSTLDAVDTNTTTSIPEAKRGAHANLIKDVTAGGNFNGSLVSFSFAQGADTCSNISCHGAYSNVAWTATPGNCDNCHGTFGVTANGVPMPGAAVPKHTGALSNPDGDVNTTLYNSHQGAAALGANGEGYCDYCHANNQAAYLPAMHIDGTIQLNSSMTYQGVSGSTGVAAGCANACHSAASPYQMSDSGYTLAAIGGQGFTCASCHGDPPTSGAHAAHVIDNGDTDRTDCANCHSGAALYTNAGSPNGNHRNGAVNVFGEWDAATTALGVQWSNNATPANPADDRCGNACHLNNGVNDVASGKVVPLALWGDTSLDCSSCHYYDVQPTAARNNALPQCQDSLHNAHFGDGTPGVWKVCSDCHMVPGAGDTTHISSPGAVSDGVFFQDKAKAEEEQEATVTRANITFNGVNATTGAIGGVPDLGGPNNRCAGTGMAAGCHATGTANSSADWDVYTGSPACNLCHTDNSPTYNPYTGIHDLTPTVSGVRHDNTLDNSGTIGVAGCEECHTAAPSTLHHNGTLNATPNAAGNTAIVFAPDVGYQDAATPTCMPVGTLVSCHSEGGQWRRQWTDNVAATNGNECAGCHGTFALGWTAGAGILTRPSMIGVGGPGVLAGGHDSDWDGDANAVEVSPNHGGCKSCHGMNSQADKEATYLAATMWDPTGATSAHGDGDLQLNGPSADAFAGAVAGGAEYNGNDDAVLETSDWACTNACHSGTGNDDHNMGDSGWPVAYADFGAGSCNGCHGYPPLPSVAGIGPGNYADARVEDYAGGGAGHDAPDHLAATVTAGDGWTPCQKCHPSTSHAQGGGTVLRANLQVTFPATYNAKSGTATFTAGAAPTAATCAAVSCHGGITTPAWTGAITVNSDAGCRACHKIEAVADRATATEHQSAISGGHGRAGSVSLENHTAGDASLGDTTESSLCTQCHGLPAQHFAGLDTAALDALTDADFVATYDGTGGYISLTNGCAVTCHSDTLGGAPQWGRKWSTTITATNGTECANCHGTFALGWATGAGTLARPNMNGVTGPAALTGPHTADWDGDATADEVSPYHGICKNCHGMNSQADREVAYLATTMWDPTGSQSDHGDRRITINGPSADAFAGAVAAGAEYNGNDDATLEVSDFSCTRACHSGTANNNHNMGDSGWALNYKDFGSGSCNGCHGYPPLASVAGIGAGNYADAALEDYTGGGAGHDTPSHVAPTATAADGWTPCQKCHPDTNHMQGGASVSRGNVQVTMPATYNAKSGTATFTAGAAPTAATCAQVSCHGAQTTPVWSGGTINVNTQCTACHIRENVANRTAATQYQSAISGLHAVTTTVSGKDHWTDTAATCGGASSCHLGQPTNHLGATLATSALDAVNNLRAGVTAASCAIACHSDSGRWARLNDKAKATALITDLVNVCATCHGTFASGWTAGAGTLTRPNLTGVGGPVALTGPHTANWDADVTADEVSPNHATCKNCHGMNSQADREATYLATTMWDPTGVQSDHGDGFLTINGPSADDNGQTAAGAEYNANKDGTLEATDYACTKACHQGAGNDDHNMGASGYARAAIEYKDFGSGSCNGCHGYPPLPAGVGGSAGNYLDAGTEDYAGGGAGHDAPDHVAPTVTAADGFTPCLKCHPDSNHMQGGAVVNRTNIQVSMAAAYNAKNRTAIFTAGGAPTAATCAAVSCHGGIVTPAWSGGTINVATDAGCRACHKIEAVANRTAATEHQSAISGGHGRAGSVSLENHTATDASLGDTTDSNLCTHCHGLPAQHFTGLDTAALDALTDADFVATYDGTGGYISLVNGCAVTCHSDTLGGAPQWGRKWSTTITATNGTECANCHGDFATGWVTGFSPSHNKANMNITGNHEVCKMCHVYDDVAYDFVPKWDARTVGGGTSMHGNRQITMNNSASVAYSAATNGCVTVCHGNDAAHQITPDSGWPVQLVAGPGASCTSCHSSTGSASALGVFSTSSHVKTTRTGSFTDCTTCHGGHADGVTGVNDVEIPQRTTTWRGGVLVPTMTREYTLHGSKIRLGGTATAGLAKSAEAEICWGCHDAAGTPAVSEWGTNTTTIDVDPIAAGVQAYDWGDLYTTLGGTTKTSNWTTGFWSSGQGRTSANPFWYKRGSIMSTHSANFDSGTSVVSGTMNNRTETKDAAGNIRCSYCHDVHNGTNGDGATKGAPFLRGTWRSNPYREDGAPRQKFGTAYYTNTATVGTTTLGWGRVPRGTKSNAMQLGGYWIDANSGTSGTPTNGWTAANSAGLCLACHSWNSAGTSLGATTAAIVNSMDWRTGEGFWVGTVGHANAVIGGDGTGRANIFDARGGVTTLSSGNPLMKYEGSGTDPARSGWGHRTANTDSNFDTLNTPKLANSNTRPYKWQTVQYEWAGTTINPGTTTDTQYHKFPCAKCHNPHASRLPKLMITNCLDTKINTWDNQYDVMPATAGTLNRNETASNWSSAQNCHRLAGDDPTDTRDTGTGALGSGWNTVTPWTPAAGSAAE